MTNPELEPNEVLALNLRRELRQGFCSPIEQEAILFLQEVGAHIPVENKELLHRATRFVTNLVGWRSQDADPVTGRVIIGLFDLNDDFGRRIDRYGRRFLTQSKSVTPAQVITEEGTEISEYTYEQFRKNGKVRKVSIRRQHVGAESQQVEYSVGYVDIGEHSGGSELLLDLARASLQFESTPKLGSGTDKTAELDDTTGHQHRRGFLKFLL